ncbi:RTC5 [Candida theae]|uniref:RTC5 n=1 Tax=Candida theae TaxID=1198502 RepID=A0AAD5BCN3_9ASCO|nr:RTC5 [Candida theae]KAI5955478.1 RTC5 [Candida theae]
MGQTPSTNHANDSRNKVQRALTKTEIYNLYYTRCLQVLKPSELAFVKSVVRDNKDDEKGTKVVSRDKLLAQFLNVSTTSSDGSNRLLDILFPIMKRLGQFPFLQDNVAAGQELTLHEFVIALTFISARYTKMLGSSFNFLGLLFVSLSQDKSIIGADIDKFEETPVEIPLIHPFEESDDMNLKARKVDWKNCSEFGDMEDVATQTRIDASGFVTVTTLALIAKSIPLSKQSTMGNQLISRIRQWDEFESYAVSLLRFVNVNLSSTKLDGETISYHEFSHVVTELVPNLYQDGLKRLAAELFTSPKAATDTTKGGDEDSNEQAQKKHFTFEPTKLVTPATLCYISSLLKGSGSNLQVTTENAVKLYAGSESGFSIRSLETKIFKWQAPTFLVVSGKRIKQKTIDTNRRYQKFDESYPRYFLKQENNLQVWQHENDRITYCVVIREPWQSSNKKNFGDESTTIISISPRADCYKSTHSDVTKGKSVYFNNQGMGLGFGNLQPLNKNGNQRYYPGDVSLTIEANLEFAVFRHLAQSTTTNHATNFFKPSCQSQLCAENFEDRFTITDLEVWGIGSMKELDEQRQQWEWEEKQANARQSVNLRSMGEERAFLEMAGLVGNHGNYGSG